MALLIFQGVGIEMERLAAKMGGSRKFAYNESECLDADYFKVQFFWIRHSSGALILQNFFFTVLDGALGEDKLAQLNICNLTWR